MRNVTVLFSPSYTLQCFSLFDHLGPVFRLQYAQDHTHTEVAAQSFSVVFVVVFIIVCAILGFVSSPPIIIIQHHRQ